ncbi:unnamed protein product [Clonostachys rosea f. rosea IK726]|uniref:Uncharacterized protein n=1 Tax=Clonostachys rosea f. rosea IK726 TaxID=1349383 RepID=A0ACA9UBC3_BIOOC|nr:unnamed protein product [Clonostachys rosea f. rosea IK726]
MSNKAETIYAKDKAEVQVGNRTNIYHTNDSCLADLRSTDPRDDKTRIERTKGGLLEDSYRWILNNDNFQQWRNDEQSRLLWIKGDPGKGKTMLLCGIIKELKKQTANLVSYFFCQSTDSRINNATAVLRGLIYLLVCEQPLLIPHVRKKYDQAGKALFVDMNAWVALSEIFANILQDPNLDSTFLIIDALDQCVSDLPHLLDLIVEKSSESPRVKWVVSSRNWPNIEEQLETVGQKVKLCLELNERSISAAVSIYVKHKVDRLARLKEYDDKTRDAVQHDLSSNANGTFLWVALACQDLEKVPRRNGLAKLKTFPPGLDSLCKRMTEPIRNSDHSDMCIDAFAEIRNRERPSSNRSPSPSPSPSSKRRPPVATVPGQALFLAARKGNKNLFLRILQSGTKITEVEPDGTTVLQAAAEKNQLDVVRSLIFFGADPNLGGGRTRSPLLAATDRQHEQVVAALLEANADPCAVHPEAPPLMKSAFHSTLYHQNSEILSMLLGARADLNVVPGLLQYACSIGTFDAVQQLLDNTNMSTNLDINKVSKDEDFFGTALRVAVINDRADISALRSCVYENSEILLELLRNGADRNAAPILQYACSIGTFDAVQQLLENTNMSTNLDINKVSKDEDFFGTALRVAVINDRADIVSCLLEHEADPNITQPHYYPKNRSPLFAAVYTKNSEILSMLLRNRADRNAAPILQYACSIGTFDAVQQLLDNTNMSTNLDINKVSKDEDFFGTALRVAVINDRTDVISCLLEHEADPNITQPHYYPKNRSPLFAAVYTKNSEILLELLRNGADPNVVPGLLPYVAQKK